MARNSGRSLAKVGRPPTRKVLRMSGRVKKLGQQDARVVRLAEAAVETAETSHSERKLEMVEKADELRVHPSSCVGHSALAW